MPNNIIVLRHAGIAPVPSNSVLSALSPALTTLNREDHPIDTTEFAAQVDQGDWGGQAAFLAEASSRIRERVAVLGNAELHYFGLAEIPHVIALGAFLGDEVPIHIYEYDRDEDSWAWPLVQKTLDARVIPDLTGSPVPAPGSAVLRVAISFPISDKVVQEVAGMDHLADLTVTLAEGLAPEICKVRSNADLQEIKLKIREALASIRARFPNLDTLHVFAAAPVSVCFALGQELKPRNSPPVQIYRYRKVDGQPAYSVAIELTSDLETRAESPLTEDEHETVRKVRSLWQDAVTTVDAYASMIAPAAGASSPWYETLSSLPEVRTIRPFPSLPQLRTMVRTGATVDPRSFPAEYEFSTPELVWRLSDRLLLGLHESTDGNAAETSRIVRLFLFHEYLHAYHSLTAYRASGIGAFPNCLEHADYVADSYALMHQLDLEGRGNNPTETSILGLLRDQVERVVRSFWAFESRPPVREWQVRRFRRYLNWYWRLTQIGFAQELITALRLLNHAPHVEIAGLHQFARGQRVFCRLDRLDARSGLEFAVILENEKILRVPNSTTSNLNELLMAFQHRDHNAIVRFFKAVYEQAEELGGALPG